MSFSSNSVIAKSRAILGRSLTSDDYAQLSSKTSVAEVCAYLKQTPRYAKALAGVNPQTVHRGQLEALLDKAVFDIFEGFHKFDFSASRTFFTFIVRRLELEQIITAIEGVFAGSTDRYISALPTFLIDHASVDLLALGKAKTLVDINELISGTSYGRILRPLLLSGQEQGKISIHECERRLRTANCISMMKTLSQSYKGGEKTELKRAILKALDMENVVTCYRMYKFRNANSEQARSAMLPFKYRLSADTIDRLMQLESIAQIEKELDALGYHTASPAQFDTIEQLTESINLSFLRRQLRLSQNSSTVYFALMECLQTELRNIKTVIEGTRYGIGSGEILDMLVM